MDAITYRRPSRRRRYGCVPVEPVERFLGYLASVERSPNTIKAYAHDLKDWFSFLAFRGLAPLSPLAVPLLLKPRIPRGPRGAEVPPSAGCKALPACGHIQVWTAVPRRRRTLSRGGHHSRSAGALATPLRQNPADCAEGG